MLRWLIDWLKKLFSSEGFSFKRWPYKKKYEHGNGGTIPLFGCTVHWDSEERMLIKIDRAKSLGCVFLRTDCIYEHWENKYYLKRIVDRCMARGLKVVFVMGMGSNLDCGEITPSSVRYIGEYVKWLKEFTAFFNPHKYKNHIILQILNEPNSRMFYDLTPRQYMGILIESYGYLKYAGWKEVIMCGLVGEEERNGYLKDYVNGLFDEGLNAHTDAFCFHWYRGADSSYTWAAMENIKLARDRGFKKFIYITEFGTDEDIPVKKRVFNHMYKEFGKEYGVNIMCWYCMQNRTPHSILSQNLNRTEIFNHIKENM